MKDVNSTAYPTYKAFHDQTILLAMLLIGNNKKNYISVEKLSDLAVQGGENELIEVKESASNNNPLSNSSPNLWKTLYNWVEYFYKNNCLEDIEKYALTLLVFSGKERRIDIADDLKKCLTEKDIKKIIQRMKEEVIKKPNLRSESLTNINNDYASNKKSKDTAYFVRCLLSKEYIEYFKNVCKQFKYELYEKETCLGILRSNLKRIYGDGEETENILSEYLGWINLKVSVFLEENKPVVIKTSEYQEFANKYIKSKMKKNKFRDHNDIVPDTEVINLEVKNRPVYIKQLEIIDSSPTIKENAAYYYLKMIKERSKWIENGFIKSIDDEKCNFFQTLLKREWENEKEVLDSTDEKINGKKLYSSMIRIKNLKLDGEDIGQDIKNGFIEELANLPFDNEKSIGWHKDYKKLLQVRDDDD